MGCNDELKSGIFYAPYISVGRSVVFYSKIMPTKRRKGGNRITHAGLYGYTRRTTVYDMFNAKKWPKETIYK